jgi:hypothetical protein
MQDIFVPRRGYVPKIQISRRRVTKMWNLYIICRCFQFCWFKCGVNKLVINPKHIVDIWFTKASQISLVLAFYVCVCLAVGSWVPWSLRKSKFFYVFVLICIQGWIKHFEFCILTWDLFMITSSLEFWKLFQYFYNFNFFFFIFNWLISTCLKTPNKCIWYMGYLDPTHLL